MKALGLGCTATLLVMATIGASAAKPAKPTTMGATVGFRCHVEDLMCNSPGIDRVRDDTAGSYAGVINSGVFDVQITGGMRSLRMYLPTANMIPSSRTCLTVGNCNPDWPIVVSNQPLVLYEAQIRVKPLTTGPVIEDLPGGLTAMNCGQENPGLVDFTFSLPSNDGHWGLNFNPKAYPGTSGAVLKRVDSQSWTAETPNDNTNDVGELLSWVHSGIQHKNGPSHEGRFHVPFKLTITTAVPLVC
jgi:hypothetical protein